MVMELYKVYINHEGGMTFTYFTTMQIRSAMHLNGDKNRKMSFYVRKLARNEQLDRRFMFRKNVWFKGVSAPAPGLYTFSMRTIL